MPEPSIKNRFPDCIAMKLHVEENAPVSAGSPLSRLIGQREASHDNEAMLSLSINFSGEQEVEVPAGRRLGLPAGRATFGIRRGQMRLTLSHCTLPLEKTALRQPLKVSMEVEMQTSSSREVQANASLETRSVGAKAAQGSTEKVTVEVFQVKKTGGESEPKWIFEAQGGRTFLEGSMANELLGMLDIAKRPYEITADFTVRGEDIQITWGQMGAVQNIHRNRLAVIERLLTLRYIKPLVEASALCEWRCQHG